MKQDTELFELCKQVYEATGWRDTLDYQWMFDGRINSQRANHVGVRVGWWYVEGVTEDCIPLYTSDYLLEKLPSYLLNHDFWIQNDGGNWTAGYMTESGSFGDTYWHWTKSQNADTPLKALLKLVLALKEAEQL